jgi:hypothetical protein
MSTRTRIALCAAIILGLTAAASAATKTEVSKTGNAPLRRSLSHPVYSYGGAAVDSNDPAATGGGSIGYNRNQFLDDW